MSTHLDRPLVSVVIPCLNEERHITQTLDALAAQDYANFELVIVDGGSTDGTLELIKNWGQRHAGCRLRLVANPQRHIPHALNLGIAAAQGEIIARLDGHVWPRPDYVSRCVGALNQPRVGVCGGIIQVQPEQSGIVPAAIALAVSTPLGAGDAHYRLGGQRVRDVDTVPFGCYRKTLWQAVGGYTEDLLANEDYDFHLRVRQAGWLIRLDPAIQSLYFARSSYRALADQYWRYGWWKARMLRRHPTAIRWRQAVPVLWSVGGLALLGAALGLRWNWAWLPWAVYVSVLSLEAWRLRSQSWQLALALVWAYMIIHFAWGWGYWAGLATSKQNV